MAVRYAIASGNWSNPAIWDGGVSVPGVGDDVYCNAYVVNIDVDIFSSSISNRGGVGITDGGYLNCVVSGSTNRTIVGSLHHSDNADLIINSGSGTINIVGNIKGYGTTYAFRCITVNITGIINIIGTIEGGNSYGQGVYLNNPGGTTNVTGNVQAVGAGYAVWVRASSAKLVVNGNAIGSSIAAAIQVDNGITHADVTLNGCAIRADLAYYAIVNETSIIPIYVQSLEVSNSGLWPTYGRMLTTNNSSTINVKRKNGQTAVLIDVSELNGAIPLQSDVRAGINYYLGTKTGTCAVPQKESVGFGVPVDDTEGEAVFSFSDWLAALTASSNPIAQRLKNVATPESVAALIETSLNG